MSTNTSELEKLQGIASATDTHLRVVARDGAIVLTCGCGDSRSIGPSVQARRLQLDLVVWCGQHYDCSSGVARAVAPQEAATRTQAPMREVDLKAEAKRSSAARKAFNGKLVDLFGVDREDLAS